MTAYLTFDASDAKNRHVSMGITLLKELDVAKNHEVLALKVTITVVNKHLNENFLLRSESYDFIVCHHWLC